MVALSAPAPVPTTPGAHRPSSPDPDAYVRGRTALPLGDTVQAEQLRPVPGVETRRAALGFAHTFHDQKMPPRNTGGRVNIFRRSPSPDGDQERDDVTPGQLYLRGEVPVWTDPFVTEL